MQHIENLPPELCCKPDPLVVLSGLDTEKNSVHRSIWKAFTSGHNREREAFKFRCRPIDHQFPKPKAKPTTAYEWFLPKGILKTGWMRKHLEEIPAVVAVFYDLDWDERQWEEKSAECAQRLDTVRSKLAGRECKLVLVLIQKRAPLPLGDDLNAMERAQALCTKCDLPGKNLFVLSHTNLLYGCITRLESEFHDMATNYYHNRAKKVKSHKDTLNKASHQLLLVRHEFKIAFFGELKKDPALALKHYQQAYSHLLEQRMIDIHMLEMKTIAGFINYKICRLAFQSKASDAISQFRRHIEFFSNIVGMPQLAFEHEAWMSKQFEILGDLFQEAIQLSLTALMTQHPGLYYQEAARHAIARRQLCHVLCAQACAASAAAEGFSEPQDMNWMPVANQSQTDNSAISDSVGSVPSSGSGKRLNVNTAVEFVRTQSPLRFTRHSPSTPASPVNRSPSSAGPVENTGSSATEKLDGLEFYGQRPWRQGIQSMEPPNAAKEREGILALQKAELNVDHSAIIIPLLEQTHLQYKRYKAERMKLYPCVLMGSEYYRNGNYAKALSCYTSVLSDYRREKWWEIYTFVLKHIMKCAYATVQPTTFLSAGLELIGPNSQLTLPEKELVQRLLFQLFRHEVPNAQQFMHELGQITEETKDRWLKCLNPGNDRNIPASASELPVSGLEPDGDVKVVSGDDSLSHVNLDVSRLNVCVECKVAFTQSCFTIDQPVQLAIFLRSFAPLPFAVSRVTAEFTHNVVDGNQHGSGTERTPLRSTSKHTSQSWTQSFNLDSSASFTLVLLSLDSETLGKHIKVDSVQLMLNCPDSGPDANDVPVSLVWHWSSAELSNTASTTHHSHRSAASTQTHRGAATDRAHLDPAHGPDWCSLWNTSVPTSAIDRTPQSVIWETANADPSGPFELPSIPPGWDLIGTQLQTEILDHNSKLQVTLSHFPPALTREAYTMRCEILNNEHMDATHMSLFVQLREGSSSAVGGDSDSDNLVRDHAPGQRSADQLVIGEASCLPQDVASATSTQPSSTVCSSQLADLVSGDRFTCPISFRCLLPGRRSVRCRLTYETKLPNPLAPDFLIVVAPESLPNSSVTRSQARVITVDDQRVNAARGIESVSSGVIQSHCVKSTVVDLDVLEPFGLTWQTLSLEQWPISDLIVGDDFLLQLTLANTSSCELEVLNTSFELTPSISFSDGAPEEQLNNLRLESDECASECQVLVVSHAKPGEEVINLGSYVVRWRRCRNSSSDQLADESHSVTTTFSLLSCSLLELPVRVRVDMPSFGTLLTPMNVTYLFENQTIYPQEAQITLEPSPNFMFSGQNKLKVRLLPDSPQYLSYVFLPLRSGNVMLPRLRVSLTRFGQPGSAEQHTLKLHMEEKMLRPIPTHLFVVPSGKGIGAKTSESLANPVSSG